MRRAAAAAIEALHRGLELNIFTKNLIFVKMGKDVDIVLLFAFLLLYSKSNELRMQQYRLAQKC